MSNDFITQVAQLTFRSVPASAASFPAKEFIETLDADSRRDFLVAARILASSCASGRPPSGRAQRIAGSRQLFELRITPRGRTGPHHRLLYVRDRNTIWVLRGLTKRERLSRREIELAERLLASWRGPGQ